jgi:hypothetical protein
VSKNVASLERVLRVLVGLVFLSLAITGPESVWGLLGLIPLITGVTGRCPLYAMLESIGSTPRHGHVH